LSLVVKREGKIEIQGFDPDHPGLVVVAIPLNTEPDADWISCFEHPSTYSPSIHLPKVSGKYIIWKADKDRVDKHILWIFKYIDQANACYERVSREKEEKKARMEHQEKIKENELEEIRKKLENL
jgi:hypothetical protein